MDSADREPADPCPAVDLERHDGKPTRYPSACGELARLRAECGLPEEDCELDAECDERECFLYCLHRTRCDRLAEPTGDRSTQRCFEDCRAHVFCGGGFLEPERLCDGVPDCPIGDDEREGLQPDGSRKCDPTLADPARADRPYFCLVGRGFGFIQPWRVCDGNLDCTLGDDEREESCHKGSGYLCRGTDQRLARRQVCDGIRDCPHGDDEPCGGPALRECPPLHPIVAEWVGPGDVCSIASLGPRPPRTVVLVDPPKCESGETLWPEMRCNGQIDCASGEDEADCPIVCEDGDCFFPCAGGDVLVPLDAICDSTPDCPLGDDEPCIDRLYCDDERSVPFEEVCDGTAHCENGADEADCPVDHFVCHDGTQILYPFITYMNRICTVPQCDDESDLMCLNPP